MRRERADGLDIGVYGARGVPSTYSGYETFLTLLLPELVARGDRVTAYCRSGEGFDDSDWQGVHRKVLTAVGELDRPAFRRHPGAIIHGNHRGVYGQQQAVHGRVPQ